MSWSKRKIHFQFAVTSANGKAIADLHLGGTGGHPELKGIVKLQGVEALCRSAGSM